MGEFFFTMGERVYHRVYCGGGFNMEDYYGSFLQWGYHGNFFHHGRMFCHEKGYHGRVFYDGIFFFYYGWGFTMGGFLFTMVGFFFYNGRVFTMGGISFTGVVIKGVYHGSFLYHERGCHGDFTMGVFLTMRGGFTV